VWTFNKNGVLLPLSRRSALLFLRDSRHRGAKSGWICITSIKNLLVHAECKHTLVNTERNRYLKKTLPGRGR
jgi:hypothetical protein